MIIQALLNLKPGAIWTLNGSDYEGLIWSDTSQTKPTKQEIETEIARLEQAYVNTEYQRLRAREYPPITDYLDAVVKGDQAQIDKYLQDCLAVKARYPKPE